MLKAEKSLNRKIRGKSLPCFCLWVLQQVIKVVHKSWIENYFWRWKFLFKNFLSYKIFTFLPNYIFNPFVLLRILNELPSKIKGMKDIQENSKIAWCHYFPSFFFISRKNFFFRFNWVHREASKWMMREKNERNFYSFFRIISRWSKLSDVIEKCAVTLRIIFL